MERKNKQVVIIGSGMGGLACGIILLKEGYDVTILEKNRQFGGNLQIFVRDKCIFDTGVHYIGGLGEGQNLNKLFKYFGIMKDLKLKKCDEDGYDKITFDGDDNEYFHAQGYENFIRILLKQFPDEEEGLRKYCKKLQEVCNEFPIYRLEPTAGNLINSKSLEINTKDFIASCTDNVLLQKVLGGTNPLYAGVADKTPLYVHALIIDSYIEGSYKCVDGGAQIERLLSRVIKKLGGKMLKYKNVNQIVCGDDGAVKYVETSEGEKFAGDYFISNIDLVNTLEMLVNSNIRKAYRNRINSLENTISTFIVNIVLKENTFKYQNYNHYHYHVEDVWEGVNYKKEEWPAGYAAFCPPNSKSEEYADCLSLFAYMNYEDVRQWEDTLNIIPNMVSERAQSYDEFKNNHAEILIDKFCERYPGFREKIKSYTVSTPLTYRDYIGSKDGTMYGVMKDCKEPLRTFIPPVTKVPNLLLTGQNLNMHGILGVTIGALVTAGALIDLKELINKINAVN